MSMPVPKRNANMQIGDLVQKAGIYTKPGVVVEKKDDGTVLIDTDQKEIEKYPELVKFYSQSKNLASPRFPTSL